MKLFLRGGNSQHTGNSNNYIGFRPGSNSLSVLSCTKKFGSPEFERLTIEGTRAGTWCPGIGPQEAVGRTDDEKNFLSSLPGDPKPSEDAGRSGEDCEYGWGGGTVICWKNTLKLLSVIKIYRSVQRLPSKKAMMSLVKKLTLHYEAKASIQCVSDNKQNKWFAPPFMGFERKCIRFSNST